LTNRIKFKATVVVMAFAVSLLVAAGALAASKPPAYRGQGPEVQSQVQAGAHGIAPKTVGILPFTGLDLALFVGAGLLLLLAGGTLRRLGKRRA
jgi:hypothetical protein